MAFLPLVNIAQIWLFASMGWNLLGTGFRIVLSSAPFISHECSTSQRAKLRSRIKLRFDSGSGAGGLQLKSSDKVFQNLFCGCP